MASRRGALLSAPLALRRGAWNLTGALFLEVLACSVAVTGLLQGGTWWSALTGIAALMLVVPAVLRTFGVSAWAASAVDLAAFVALVDLLYARRESLLGFIPTPATIGRLHELFAKAVQAIQDQGVPAEPLPELLFFIVVFGGVFAIVLDVLAVALRAPALTALAMLAVLAVPSVLQPGGLTLVSLALCAAAWFVVLRADGRLRRGTRGGANVALAIGASVIVISVFVAATAPGFARVGRVEHDGPVAIGNSVNPLIDLAKDLRRPVPVDVLRYTTAATTPSYLQLTTLDSFSGTVWRHRATGTQPLDASGNLGAPPGLELGPEDAGPKSVTTTVDIQNLTSDWLPVPYPATSVRTAAGAAGYQSDDLTVYANEAEQSGTRYRVTSLALEPTEAQIAAGAELVGGRMPSAVQRDLYLPPQVPQIITDTARQVAAGAGGTSELAVATALQNYFQNSTKGFSYSTNTPDMVGGSSLRVVARFLQDKEGYCVHFATAMAVMARVLGIPSRIAIGYVPGMPVGTRGKQTVYQIDSSDLHAWPQLYFPGVGWLGFEPTVSRGAAPSYTVAQLGTSAPAPSWSTTAVPSPTPYSPTEPKQPAADPDVRSTNAVADRNGVPVALGGLILLGLLATPMVARLLRRQGRLSRLRNDGRLATLAWDEVRDTARDLGLASSPTETPRAFAERLRASWHPSARAQSDLDEILEQVERAEYGPPRTWERHFQLAETTERVLAALRAARPARARVLALLAPVSLFAPILDRQRAGTRTSG